MAIPLMDPDVELPTVCIGQSHDQASSVLKLQWLSRSSFDSPGSRRNEPHRVCRKPQLLIGMEHQNQVAHRGCRDDGTRANMRSTHRRLRQSVASRSGRGHNIGCVLQPGRWGVDNHLHRWPHPQRGRHRFRQWPRATNGQVSLSHPDDRIEPETTEPGY